MAKSLEQRIAQLEKMISDFFTGGKKKPARKTAKSARAKKPRKVAKRKTSRKA
jgi:hypothetical protein